MCLSRRECRGDPRERRVTKCSLCVGDDEAPYALEMGRGGSIFGDIYIAELFGDNGAFHFPFATSCQHMTLVQDTFQNSV